MPYSASPSPATPPAGLPALHALPDAASLLEAAPAALLVVGADGLVQFGNAAARRLCGAAAVVGLPLAALCRDAADAALLCGTLPLQRQLQVHGNGTAGGSGGEAAEGPVDGLVDGPVWVEATTQPLPGGGWMIALRRTHSPGPRGLAEAQSALELAVDMGNIAVWRHELATARVYYNDQAYRVLDIPPRPEGLTLDEVRGFIHPDDIPAVVASAQRALRETGPTDMEARYRRADGSWRQVMTRRVVQRDAEGQPVAFIGVALDVTARHDEQRRADEMTRRFELATGAAGIGHWVMERGAERPTWSEPLRAIFGLPAGEPVPRLSDWIERFVHPDDRETVRSTYGEWARSKRARLASVMRAQRPDGSVRHLATHSLLEGDGERPLMFGVVIDLTERHNAEQALRTAEESVALATRGAGLGTWQLDLQTGQASWDAQMWLLRGHAPQSRAMTPDERAACLHPDDRASMQAPLDAAIARGLPFESDFRVVWPDGQVRWLSSRSVEISEPLTGARRRIGVNWDITDKRNGEVARREREIAQRESQAKSRFLARMSHELRTPLNAVLGFTQLLRADDTGTDVQAQTRRERLAHVQAAGQHLLALINDMLDLSSLESGELRIALQPVALAPLAEQTLSMLGSLRAHQGVQITLGPLPGQVLADATRLRQVLLNLLSNAVKYNRPGGRVTVEARPVESDAGAQVALRVTDTGHGMNPEQMRQLFEPFNRLGRQSDEPGAVEGSGIGLAIVKALVERMGGTVHAVSTPGRGSVFEVRLADAAAAAAVDAAALTARGGTPAGAGAGSDATASATVQPPAPQPTPAGPPLPARGTLLYIEDNPVNALIIQELVARRGDLRLHVAVDGHSGVRRALELQPDLVLLDMQLPDIDGHEVLARLRAEPTLATVPVIALSANAMPDDIEAALRAGMSDYWTKPLDFAAFMASLETLFGPER